MPTEALMMKSGQNHAAPWLASTLPAVPLLTVLLLAVLLLAPGSAGAEKPARDRVLAKVNGLEILESEVYASIESLSLGDQIDVRGDLEVYIEAIINEEVLFQWALQNNFAQDGKLRRKVKDMVVRRLIEKHVRSKIRVSEAEVRAYYKQNPSLVRGEHVQVRRILLGKRSQCERMMRRIDSEDAFIQLAKVHSLDAGTAPQGGDSGPIMRGEGQRVGYELEFFDMKVGEMRIFDLPAGCMLVRSILYIKPPLPPFEAVRGSLREFLENREEVRLVEKLFQTANKGMKVERSYAAP